MHMASPYLYYHKLLFSSPFCLSWRYFLQLILQISFLCFSSINALLIPDFRKDIYGCHAQDIYATFNAQININIRSTSILFSQFRTDVS